MLVIEQLNSITSEVAIEMLYTMSIEVVSMSHLKLILKNARTMSAFAPAPVFTFTSNSSPLININLNDCTRSDILAHSVIFLFSLFSPLRAFCFVLLHPMSPSRDGDSTLEPTAGSSRNSSVNHPAVEEPIHSNTTMHAYERAGTPQIPDSESESEIKHTQASLEPTAESSRNSLVTHPSIGEPANSWPQSPTIVVSNMLMVLDHVAERRDKRTQAADDSLIVEPDQKADTADYLAWKSAGRPICQQCLKSHPPPCKSSQEDIDFCQRDPEGYKLYLKSIKPARKQKTRSNRRPELPGHNTSRVSRPALTQAQRLYTPGLSQTQRLYTLAAYNSPPITPAQAHRVDTHAAHANTPATRQDDPPSPWLTAFMKTAAVNAANDPAGIRALLAPSDTYTDHQRISCRALSRVFEDALAQNATDAAEQTQQ